MLVPSLHPRETERLATLRELNILDTPTEERFDRITRVAAKLFNVPIALISLVDSDRQWFKSCLGVPVRQTARQVSFCAHAILSNEIFYVPNACDDPRFSDNPLVAGEPHLRFYAGFPLAGPNGLNVGTLCVMDVQPHYLNENEMRLLRDLGAWAHLELTTVQILQKEIARQGQKILGTERTFFEFLESLPVGVYVLDASGEPYYANQAAQQILGKGIAPGATAEDLTEIYNMCIAGTDQPYPTERRPSIRALSGKSSSVDDIEIRGPNGNIQVQVWGTPIFHNGAVAYGIVAFQDITDRKRGERRLAAQHAVTQALAESSSLTEATPKILRAICNSTGWDLGALWTINYITNDLRCVDLWHQTGVNVEEFESLTRRLPLPSGMGLPGRVWATGEPTWIPDIVEDANFPRVSAALRNSLHAAFAFPIVFEKKISGILEFFSRQIQKPDNDLLAMMGTLGSQIGQFIARKRTETALQESEERYRAAVESK